MEEKDKYISFYDQFTSDPKKNETSVLHMYILEKLIAEGLKSNHKVLEAGCGLGELSHLIAQKVKKGKVIGVDPNEETIAKASKLWERQKNLSFIKAVMKAYNNKEETFDFFILSEILQQISSDKHFRLFEAVKRHSHKDSVVFINLPTPGFLQWKAQNDPESLQYIEPMINIGGLVESLTANGFYLEKALSYNVFYEENDFQYLIFKPISKIQAPTPKNKWNLMKDRFFNNPLNLF